ncbi:phosphatase PAP2 family protein [soil metagenome]
MIPGKLLQRITPRDRGELSVLLAGIFVLVLALAFVLLAGRVIEGDTQQFDEWMLAALRDPGDPAAPIGPRWLHGAALDITALGGATVLGLAVVAVCGFLLLQGLQRYALFVFVASCGGWLLNNGLKAMYSRPRPDVVPHLREVMTLSFPSGHAMTSAVVYLTLGVLLMRVAQRPLARFYCVGIAMLTTALVGASRVYLGVHYPTDVLAGWLIGLSWALVCWIVERALDRRAGLRRERALAG